jgi:hypothetical protein
MTLTTVILLGVIQMFSVLLLICYRSSVINESFQALGTLKGDLEDVYVLNAQIESDIQTQTDLSNIETYAKYQLRHFDIMLK